MTEPESRFAPNIATLLHQRMPHVRHTLRCLREAGITPGKRAGDLSIAHLADVIFGLTSPMLPAVAQHVRTLRNLVAADETASLPRLAGDAIGAIVAILPKSPVLGDLDLDDGFIAVGDDRVVIEVLSLTGSRAVIRYGAGATSPQTSPIHRFALNDIRVLSTIIGRNP